MSVPAHSKTEWVTAVARPNTPLFLSFLISGQERTAIEHNAGLQFGFLDIRREGIKLQYRRDELSHAAGVVRERSAEEGLVFFERYAARCEGSCSALLATVDELAAGHDCAHDLHSLGSALGSYFAGAIALGTFLQTLIVVQFELEAVLSRFVADRLHHASDQTIAVVLGALQIAVEPTDELRNLLQMLELAALVQRTAPEYQEWIGADPVTVITSIAYQHDSIWASIESYLTHFGWMGRRYYSGDPITAVDLVVRLQNLLHEDCATRIADMADRRDAHLQEREQAIAKLGGDAAAQGLAGVLSRYMYLRSHRLDVFFIAHERVAPLFERLTVLLGLGSYDDPVYLAWQELTEGIHGHIDAQRLTSRAAERRAGFEFESHAGDTQWAPSGGPLTEASITGAPREILHGVSGWRGHLQGRVRVVTSDDDMLRMQPGEILVATMTQPRLMLAVEKASAIVTDEGGMLCHAVLVSREFNLPCVIGTERATHILRTGDLVDVDATTGVVQILNQSTADQQGGHRP